MAEIYYYNDPEIKKDSFSVHLRNVLTSLGVRNILSVTTFVLAIVILPSVLFAVQLRQENVQQAKSFTDIGIFAAAIDTSVTPWFIRITGENFTPTLVAKVFDNAVQWGGDLPVQVKDSHTATVEFPYKDPPSHCILFENCIFRLQLFDPATRLSSTQFSLSLSR